MKFFLHFILHNTLHNTLHSVYIYNAKLIRAFIHFKHRIEDQRI
jgi:hypothetical protein